MERKCEKYEWQNHAEVHSKLILLFCSQEEDTSVCADSQCIVNKVYISRVVGLYPTPNSMSLIDNTMKGWTPLTTMRSSSNCGVRTSEYNYIGAITRRPG